MSELVKVYWLEASFDCTNSVKIWQDFLTIVNRLTGVTVINSVKHDFPGGGFSGLVLIAESHAAIHTWPELHRVWVELATCGDPVALDEFEASIRHWVVTNNEL